MPDIRDKIREIRDQIDAYAPYPSTGDVSAAGLARRMTVVALKRSAWLACSPFRDSDRARWTAELDAMCADFAAAVALYALADKGMGELDLGVQPLVPEAIRGLQPAEVATFIRDIWETGELGEFLYEFLGRETAEAISGLVEQLAKLAAEAKGEDEPVIDGEHTLLGYLNSKGRDWADAIDDGAMGWFGWAVEGDLLTVKWEPQDPESGGPGPAVTQSWRLGSR